MFWDSSFLCKNGCGWRLTPGRLPDGSRDSQEACQEWHNPGCTALSQEVSAE